MADIAFASLQYHAYRYKIRTSVMFPDVKYLFTDVNTDKGPRIKSYSICLDFKRLCLGPCIINNCIFCA